MEEKIELILERLYAIKDDDKFYFMTYGKDWIEELCGVMQRSEQLKAFADFIQSDTSHLNYDFKDLVQTYLDSL